MSYSSRWLLLVSVVLQISNLEAILYSGHFFYTPRIIDNKCQETTTVKTNYYGLFYNVLHIQLGMDIRNVLSTLLHLLNNVFGCFTSAKRHFQTLATRETYH